MVVAVVARVRAANWHRYHRRIAHVDLIVGQHAAALLRLGQALRLPQLAHERHADDMGTGRNGDAHLQARVAGQLHVGLPLGRAGEARFAVPGVAGGGRGAGGGAADREPLQQPAIEADIELLGPAHAHQVVLVLPAQPDRDPILAVDRELVGNRHPAARAEREIVVLAVVLHHVQGNLEGVERRARDGEPVASRVTCRAADR